MWEGILREFCKVQFLCWYGDPNWLGWMVLGILVGFGFLCAIGVALRVVYYTWEVFCGER